MYANKFQQSPSLITWGSLGFVVLFAWLLFGCRFFSRKELASATPTLSSPTLEAFLMDRSILTDDPCQAPCWYGLELGKSGRDEIINALETLSFINPNTIEEGPYYSYWDPSIGQNLTAEYISADCRSPQQRCVVLVMVNHLLASVQLTPNYNLSLDEVVNHLGPPDYFRVVLLQDRSTCLLVFSWEQKQIMMQRDEKNGKRLCSSIDKGGGIPPDLTIDWIVYQLPNLFTSERAYGKPWPSFSVP